MMHGALPRLKWILCAIPIATLAVALGCGSKNNATPSPTTGATIKATASTTGTTVATAAAASPSAAPTTMSSAATPLPGMAAVAMSFSPPGGSAPWSNIADGCHGVPLPPGAEQPKASDTGVTPTEIKLGTTMPLTGPASSYSAYIKVMQNCFNAINADGGIYGRKLTLIVRDDQYNPANTPQLVQQLVEQERVFAIVSGFGTATQSSIYDYVNREGVPQVFPYTGAPIFSNDPVGHPWTMAGFLPSYRTAGQIFARYIQQSLKGKKIGILRQNDDFGKGYVDGLKSVLGEKGTPDNPIIDEEVYETTDADVAGQITNLRTRGVEVLFLIAIAKFGGLALRDAAQQGWHPIVLTNDIALDPAFNDLAGGKQNTEGVIGEMFYHSFSENIPAVQQVKDFLNKYPLQIEPSIYTMLGYAMGETYVEVFKRAGVNPTRKSFMQALESFQGFQIPQFLPGITLNTSKNDHAPLKCFVLAALHDGVPVPQGNAACAGG
jgi:branched-chain amino acid transport system substrate-binding protein